MARHNRGATGPHGTGCLKRSIDSKRVWNQFLGQQLVRGLYLSTHVRRPRAGWVYCTFFSTKIWWGGGGQVMEIEHFSRAPTAGWPMSLCWSGWGLAPCVANTRASSRFFRIRRPFCQIVGRAHWAVHLRDSDPHLCHGEVWRAEAGDWVLWQHHSMLGVEHRG